MYVFIHSFIYHPLVSLSIFSSVYVLMINCILWPWYQSYLNTMIYIRVSVSSDTAAQLSPWVFLQNESCHDFKIGTAGARRYRVSAGTGWPGVSIR